MRVCRGEVIAGSGVVAVAVVARHIRRASGNGDRVVEGHVLPAAGGLVREGCASEKGPGAGPQRPDVSAGVARPLVVLETRDRAPLGGEELHAEVDAVRIWIGKDRRRVRVGEQLRDRGRRQDSEVDGGRRRIVGAVRNPVGEGRGPDEASIRRERHRASLGIVGGDATNARHDIYDRERLVVRIPVVCEERRSSDLQRGALRGRETAVVDRDRSAGRHE